MVSPSDIAIIEAKQAGFIAYKTGSAMGENPYKTDVACRIAWHEGWHLARRRDIFYQGFSAFHAGEAYDDNPYDYDDEPHKFMQWHIGWHIGSAADKPLMDVFGFMVIVI